MIYGLCFTRPVPIRPGVLYYRRRFDRSDVPNSKDGLANRKYSAYRYEWSEPLRSTYKGEHGYQATCDNHEVTELSAKRHPNRDGVANDFPKIEWFTLPTVAQWVVINKAVAAREEAEEEARLAKQQAEAEQDDDDDAEEHVGPNVPEYPL